MHSSSGRMQCVPTGGCHDIIALQYPSKIHYHLIHPPLITHHSSLTAHRSSLTAHRSLLTAHSSSLIAHSSSPTAHSSSLITHRSPLIAHCSLIIPPPPSPQTKNPPPHRKWIFQSIILYIIYCVPSLCFSPAAS